MYSASVVIKRLSVFALVLACSHMFTPEEFGLFTKYFVVFSFLCIFVVSGVNEYFSYELSDFDSAIRKDISCLFFALLMLMSFFVVLILERGNHQAVVVGVGRALAEVGLYLLSLAYLQTKNKVGLLVRHNIFFAATTMLLTLAAYFFHMDFVLFSYIFSFFLFYFIADLFFRFKDGLELFVGLAAFGKLFGRFKYYYFSALVSSLYMQIPIFVFNYKAKMSNVGAANVCYTIAGFLLMFPVSYLQFNIKKLLDIKDRATEKKYFLIMFFYFFGFFLFLVVGGVDFIKFFIGKNVDLSGLNYSLMCFSVSYFFQCVAAIFSLRFIGLGRVRDKLFVSIMAVLISIQCLWFFGAESDMVSLANFYLALYFSVFLLYGLIYFRRVWKS